MKCKQSLTKYVIQDYLDLNSTERDHLISNRNIGELKTDVLREQAQHLCCSKSLTCNQNFVRNFKILYHRGDDLLFKNPNLHFGLDSENDVILKQQDFIREISGDKSSNLMMILSEKDKRSYIDQEEFLAKANKRPRGLSKVVVDGAFGSDP